MIDTSNKPYSGITNFQQDDLVESYLKKHFDIFNVDALDASKYFPIYSRRIFLKKFLAHYELFRLTYNLPGDIVELGVYRGTSLMSWANFMEIRNMGDRQKVVWGFDNFKGFTNITEKDGKRDEVVDKSEGGFNAHPFEQSLEDAIDIFDQDRFIPYKKRIRLIKGDIEETVPRFIKDNPGVRISLLHFDCDMYEPTMTGLKHLWPIVVPGGVVAFDEYGIRPWEGESRAVDEFFKNQTMRRLDWSPNPGAFIIKE